MTTIPLKTLRQKWMKDPKFRAEYERIGPAIDRAMKFAEARHKARATRVAAESAASKPRPPGKKSEV
jgi:hypothetical protein